MIRDGGRSESRRKDVRVERRRWGRDADATIKSYVIMWSIPRPEVPTRVRHTSHRCDPTPSETNSSRPAQAAYGPRRFRVRGLRTIRPQRLCETRTLVSPAFPIPLRQVLEVARRYWPASSETRLAEHAD